MVATELSYAVKSGTQLNREFIADGKMEHGKHSKNCVLKNSMARAIAVHWGDEVRVHTDLANLSVGLAQIRIRLLVISLKSHLKSLKFSQKKCPKQRDSQRFSLKKLRKSHLNSHLKSLKSHLNAIAVSRQCKLCPSFLV